MKKKDKRPKASVPTDTAEPVTNADIAMLSMAGEPALNYIDAFGNPVGPGEAAHIPLDHATEGPPPAEPEHKEAAREPSEKPPEDVIEREERDDAP